MNAPVRTPRIDGVTNRLKQFMAADNIVPLLDDEVLAPIGGMVCREYEIDRRSNSEWLESAKRALEVARQQPKPKNYPFPGAANVQWPLVTVAALQFNARAYPAIVDGDNIVKAKVVGSDKGIPAKQQAPQGGISGPGAQMPQMGAPAAGGPPMAPQMPGQPQEQQWEVEPGSKRAKADRIAAHMSYQLTEEMPEWEEDTDTLLMQLPIVGTAFRKVYFDPIEGRNCAKMIAGTELIVHRATRSLDTCPRISECMAFYPHEIQERQRSGIWIDDWEPGESANGDGDGDALHEFLEQHRYLDLDGDGYREPYIVTVHRESEKVVRIVANYAVDDITMGPTKVERIKRRDYFVKYGFIPDPSGGFYDIGFGWLLESLGASINTTINQMLDAGHIQNAGGGLIGSGLKFDKGRITLEPGVYKTVGSTGQDIRNAIYNWEHPGPSAVLFNLLGLMLDAAKTITAVQDIMTGDGKDANQTATTTLALIEQGMKVFTAIYKRIYRSLKQEFKLLFRLNAEHLPQEAYFTVMDEEKAIAREDYDPDAYDVCPQADPRLVTEMQRLARAQLLMGTMEFNPGGAQEILSRYYRAIGEEDVEKLLPKAQPDPIAIKGAEAEIRKTEAAAAKDETQAMKNVAEIEQADKEQQLEAMGMIQHGREFDRQEQQGERRAAENREEAERGRQAAASEAERNRQAAAEQARQKAAAREMG
jgi:chaperonin GroES